MHIKKSRDGIAAEARATEQMKRHMDGAPLRSRVVSDEYRRGYERIFGKVPRVRGGKRRA